MSITAADIMTTNVKTVSPDASVAEVARVLSDNGISAAPVCDDQGKVIGMLSEGDLLRPVSHGSSVRRSWWLNLLAEGTDLAPQFADYIRLDNRRARDLMQTGVITAAEGTTAPELADLLTQHHIKRVPVLCDGKLVGIVSRADLVRAMARSPEALVDPVT